MKPLQKNKSKCTTAEWSNLGTSLSVCHLNDCYTFSHIYLLISCTVTSIMVIIVMTLEKGGCVLENKWNRQILPEQPPPLDLVSISRQCSSAEYSIYLMTNSGHYIHESEKPLGPRWRGACRTLLAIRHPRGGSPNPIKGRKWAEGVMACRQKGQQLQGL